MGHYDLPTDAEVIANLRAQLADRDAEIERLKTQIDADNQRNLAIACDNIRLLHDKQELEAEIERLRAELKENEGVIAVWRGRTDRAEAEIERLRKLMVVHPGCTCGLCSDIRKQDGK